MTKSTAFCLGLGLALAFSSNGVMAAVADSVAGDAVEVVRGIDYDAGRSGHLLKFFILRDSSKGIM
jgi:hypothetical protein